jgi:tetraacyldisaccharide 4'-kinase
VDGETRGEWPFGDGSVFPAGPMREPLKVGLGRADAVIVMLPADLDTPDAELIALFAGKPLLVARLEPTGAPPAAPVFAFAGIAKPWRFERALVASGCALADFAPFPDHAPYTDEMLRVLADRAKHLGATLLTTEKDWVRLPPAWRDRIAAWPVKARFEDEAALAALLPL